MIAFFKINFIFIAVIFFIFFGVFVGSVSAGGQILSKTCLPILDIKIDGQEQDWTRTRKTIRTGIVKEMKLGSGSGGKAL